MNIYFYGICTDINRNNMLNKINIPTPLIFLKNQGDLFVIILLFKLNITIMLTSLH